MSILDSAELLLQAKNYSGSGEWLDESGNGHNAQLGSTSGADTNDPLFKALPGDQYMWLPGIAGNYLSVPNAANNAHDNLTDIWIGGRFALTDWTPASDQTLIAKWEDTSDQRSYRLMIDTTGVLRLGWSTDGTAANVVEEDSTVAPTVSNGGLLWVVGTVDISVGTVKFYTGGTDTIPVWTQLGTTVTGSGASSIHDGTAVLEVGSDNTGTAQLLIGDIYNAHVEDGYDEGVGTLQFDCDLTIAAEPYATFAEQSANGATVTVNRSGTSFVSTPIDRDLFILADDDMFSIANDAGLEFGATDPFTVVVVARANSFASGMTLMSNRDGVGATNVGYRLSETGSGGTGTVEIADGTTEASATSAASIFAVQTLFGMCAVRNIVDDDLQMYADGVASGSSGSDGTSDTLTSGDNTTIGNLNAGSNFWEGVIVASALWQGALTDEQIATAHTLLLASSTASMFDENIFGFGHVLYT